MVMMVITINGNTERVVPSKPDCKHVIMIASAYIFAKCQSMSCCCWLNILVTSENNDSCPSLLRHDFTIWLLIRFTFWFQWYRVRELGKKSLEEKVGSCRHEDGVLVSRRVSTQESPSVTLKAGITSIRKAGQQHYYVCKVESLRRQERIFLQHFVQLYSTLCSTRTFDSSIILHDNGLSSFWSEIKCVLRNLEKRSKGSSTEQPLFLRKGWCLLDLQGCLILPLGFSANTLRWLLRWTNCCITCVISWVRVSLLELSVHVISLQISVCVSKSESSCVSCNYYAA